MEGFVQKLRSLDAYPKINEDFYNRTISGGLVTLISSLFIIFLFFSEFRLYLHTVTETKLVVDTARGETLRIDFDVTFPAIRCSLLSLDAVDISGEQHFDIIERPLQRHGGRLEHDETYCGSCFGAEESDDHCCNSCEAVREAYRKKGWALTNADLIDQCKREGFIQQIKDEDGEGCNVQGSLEVNKVAGNIHFTPGKTFHQHTGVLDLLLFDREIHNISHKINKLAFGDYIPGMVNPLAGIQWVQQTPNGVYQYFVKVVPTTYTNLRRRSIHSNQYSVTEHFKSLEYGHLQSLPGVYFYYDLSPIKVTFKEEHPPFFHFVTHICAIIGGIFTIAGIVDSFIYHGQKAIKKKGIGRFD